MWFFQTIRQASVAHSVQMAFINAAKSTYSGNIKPILQGDVTSPQEMRNLLNTLDKSSIANTPGIPKIIQEIPNDLFNSLSDQEIQYIFYMIKQSPTIEAKFKESQTNGDSAVSSTTPYNSLCRR